MTMNAAPKPVVVIPAEKAEFFLDENGSWRSGTTLFQHRKIARYFHSRIRHDSHGYFLEQEHPGYIEKVYFPYRDTALFVIRVREQGSLVLCLNNGETIPLTSEDLCIRQDHLYTRHHGELVRFTDQALLSLSRYLDGSEENCFITLGGIRRPIPCLETDPESNGK